MPSITITFDDDGANINLSDLDQVDQDHLLDALAGSVHAILDLAFNPQEIDRARTAFFQRFTMTFKETN
ncbi:TPA: hypothetical protein I8V51_000400 [Corynebacterium striatum]|nr:hypothetical protein [Corynebacterium striatum]HAT1161991.1 hypothetical protein [Corynebacterium striatum]HAT1164744.1 hypothetical protein [Corynebacterium striatum]HAT1277901.1 hypothetical protein [Corynebacterium striatum]HAT1494259.1 hypothetical protein [Corynebacterium striatum]